MDQDSNSDGMQHSPKEPDDPIKWRITKPSPPKPATNPMQFVKIQPCKLYRTAQEQLKKVEEIKPVKQAVKEDAEDWQLNLDNWKSTRRKRQEHIIERVVEVKKLTQEEQERSNRRNKTFSEIVEERTRRRQHISVLDPTRFDLSDSENQVTTPVITNESTILEDRANDNECENNKEDKQSVEAVVPSELDTYERAIEDYRSRVSITSTKSLPSSETNDNATPEEGEEKEQEEGETSDASPVSELQEHENQMQVCNNERQDQQSEEHKNESDNNRSKLTELYIDCNTHQAFDGEKIMMKQQQLQTFSPAKSDKSESKSDSDESIVEIRNLQSDVNRRLSEDFVNVLSIRDRLRSLEKFAEVPLTITDRVHMKLSKADERNNNCERLANSSPGDSNDYREEERQQEVSSPPPQTPPTAAIRRMTPSDVSSPSPSKVVDDKREPCENESLSECTVNGQVSTATSTPTPTSTPTRAAASPPPAAPAAIILAQSPAPYVNRHRVVGSPPQPLSAPALSPPRHHPPQHLVHHLQPNQHVPTPMPPRPPSVIPPMMLLASHNTNNTNNNVVMSAPPAEDEIAKRERQIIEQIEARERHLVNSTNALLNTQMVLPPQSIARHRHRSPIIDIGDHDSEILRVEQELMRLEQEELQRQKEHKRMALELEMAEQRKSRHFFEEPRQGTVPHNLTETRTPQQQQQQQQPNVPPPMRSPAAGAWSPADEGRVLSVSGRNQCSHCGRELGRGAAMIIESLRLFYHVECFRCSVCRVRLGDGLMGTDVRVRNRQLHCHSCYSSDDGVKFSCV